MDYATIHGLTYDQNCALVTIQEDLFDELAKYKQANARLRRDLDTIGRQYDAKFAQVRDLQEVVDVAKAELAKHKQALELAGKAVGSLRGGACRAEAEQGECPDGLSCADCLVMWWLKRTGEAEADMADARSKLQEAV